MRKTLLTAIAAAALVSAGAFAGDTTTKTTTTWTDSYGNIIREHSVTKLHKSFDDPKLQVSVGTQLPQTVMLYDLPDTVRIDNPDRYQYVIINNEPVVVERDSRKIIHVWDAD